mmetsp:Transcript_14642/g.39207  ORF Transcript_14642/g.39207 Transcript_14642/m.39207 type:complete len:235 (+) Transcript_14642:255-959(+)
METAGNHGSVLGGHCFRGGGQYFALRGRDSSLGTECRALRGRNWSSWWRPTRARSGVSKPAVRLLQFHARSQACNKSIPRGSLSFNFTLAPEPVTNRSRAVRQGLGTHSGNTEEDFSMEKLESGDRWVTHAASSSAQHCPTRSSCAKLQRRALWGCASLESGRLDIKPKARPRFDALKTRVGVSRASPDELEPSAAQRAGAERRPTGWSRASPTGLPAATDSRALVSSRMFGQF